MGGKSFHFGAFQRVTTGQRASSRRYPLTTRLCTKFVTQWMPDTKFTTITVHDNVATPPHMDARNSEVPGGLVALTNSFIGGELWLEHDRGTSAMTIKGKMKLGMKVDLTNPFAFSAKTVLHATVPWVGDRWILAAYSISNVAANLGPETTWGLISLGFRPRHRRTKTASSLSNGGPPYHASCDSRRGPSGPEGSSCNMGQLSP